MAIVTHPSMRKGTTTQQIQQPKKDVFIVDDLSEFGEKCDNIENTESVVEQIKVESEEELETKKKLEDLIFLGRTSKIIKLAGYEFEISTLSHKEHNNLMKELAEISKEMSDVWKIRIYTLASAVKKVNGIKLEELYFDGNFNSDFKKKVAILDSMQLRVIEHLFEEYSSLLEESEKVILGDTIKK